MMAAFIVWSRVSASCFRMEACTRWWTRKGSHADALQPSQRRMSFRWRKARGSRQVPHRRRRQSSSRQELARRRLRWSTTAAHPHRSQLRFLSLRRLRQLLQRRLHPHKHPQRQRSLGSSAGSGVSSSECSARSEKEGNAGAREQRLRSESVMEWRAIRD